MNKMIGKSLTALAYAAIEAGNARLDRDITREQHAVIVAQINEALAAGGFDWRDLEAEADKQVSR